MQVARGILFFLTVCAVTATVRAAGMANDANFIVMADDQATADAVLQAANRYRAEGARQWLGHELAEGSGRTSITVVLNAENVGVTWPVDAPQRRLHQMWIWGPLDEATGALLRHESLHAVLSTAYPAYPAASRLPHWCEEGAASLYDGPQRQDIHRRTVQRWIDENRWPELRRVLEAPAFDESDQQAYSTATSVCEFLLTRGTRTDLLTFAMAGKQRGWDAALREHYGIGSLSELESAWQGWCRTR